MAGGRIFGSAPWWWLVDDTPGDRSFIRSDETVVTEIDVSRTHVLLGIEGDLGGPAGRVVNLPLLPALRYVDRMWPRPQPAPNPEQVWIDGALVAGPGAPWTAADWIPKGAVCAEPPVDPGINAPLAGQLWDLALILAGARLLGPWTPVGEDWLRFHPDGEVGARIVAEPHGPWRIDGSEHGYTDLQNAQAVVDAALSQAGYSIVPFDPFMP
jgi:hypothetical protein